MPWLFLQRPKLGIWSCLIGTQRSHLYYNVFLQRWLCKLWPILIAYLWFVWSVSWLTGSRVKLMWLRADQYFVDRNFALKSKPLERVRSRFSRWTPFLSYFAIRMKKWRTWDQKPSFHLREVLWASWKRYLQIFKFPGSCKPDCLLPCCSVVVSLHCFMIFTGISP